MESWETTVSNWGENVNALRRNTLKSYEYFVDNSWAAIRVAEFGSRSVGWGAREAGDNVITDLWVDPAYQRRGIGTALLGKLEEEIVALGYGSAYLETHARNSVAIHLYKNCGYRVRELSSKYSEKIEREVQVIGMEKELSSAADEIRAALQFLEEADYTQTRGWEKAHAIAQSNEGEELYDQLHALCHRIEGDDSNAAYWYSRGGISPFTSDFAEEAAALRARLQDN